MFTKLIPSMRIVAGLALAAGLAACAHPDVAAEHGEMHQHPMDKDAMCAMYRNMQNASTDEQRHEMMERNMQGMSPEMRQQHMEMMQRQCQ